MSKDIIGERARIGINPDAASDSQLRSVNNLLNVAGDGNAAEAWLTNYSNTPGGFNFRLAQSRGTAAVPLILQNGDYVFEIEAFAYNGTSFMEGAEIKVTVDTATGGAIVAGQAIPTRMEFWTNIVNTAPAIKAYITAFGTTVTFTPATGGAGFRLPHGVAPSSPVDGDLWTTAAGGLFGRINGVTQNYAPLASPTFTGTVGAAAVTMTGQLTMNSAVPLICTGTSDGADTTKLVLNGGGGIGTDRGARIVLNGNEAPAYAEIDLDAGGAGWINLLINGTLTSRWLDTGGIEMLTTLTTTGGGAATGINFGISRVCGIFFGSGAPTITAPKGAFYMRTDGTGTNDRAYINTNGGTTWTAIVTVA
jgi:hypothetical protein